MQTNTTSNQSYPTQEQDTALYPRSFLNHDTISAAFIEELASLESMQDNLNYIGEILKSYIAGDYGFSVKLTINGKDIKDDIYQRILKDYQYIKDEKIQQMLERGLPLGIYQAKETKSPLPPQPKCSFLKF